MCHYQRTMHFGKLARQFCTKKNSNNIPKLNKVDADYIGPPDPVSNLRPIVFHQPNNESKLEKNYRETRDATQSWNQNFWTKHNNSFIKERTKFRSDLLSKGKENVTADEMSVFYKQFLDKNWKAHVNYNITWYKKNIHLLLLEFRVRLSKFKFK